MNDWIPVSEVPKLDYYKVLFEGSGEGIASFTQRGWNLIEKSVFVSNDADIVAYKYLSKSDKEKIKQNIDRGIKGLF